MDFHRRRTRAFGRAGDLTSRARERIERSPTGRESGRVVKVLARIGYAAHGVLYLTIGALALMVATEGERARLDGRGALQRIHDEPFGAVLLVVLAIGLAGYAVWRFVQAAIDPEHDGSGGKHVVRRIGWALGGLVHAGFVVYAIGLLTGAALGGDGNAKGWAARVMAWDPVGPWLVGAVGLAFVGAAIHQLVCAWRAELDRRLDLHRLREGSRRVVVDVSRFGIAARGVVAALVGVGLVVAAIQTDPSRVKNVAEALDAIRGWSFGGLLLGLVAFGLAAYGAYGLIEARYRRIRPV